MGYIYKITSPSNRIYIGQTVNIKKRLGQYKKLDCKTQTGLFNSLNKYGYDNHIVEIIEEVNNEYLNNREIYWIDFYNSYHNGLNGTKGGEISFGIGEDNISHRPEVKLKQSLSKLEFYKTNEHPRKGKKHSEDTKAIIREKRKTQNVARFVYVLDLEMGIFYDNIKELSKLLNIEYKTFYRRIKYTSFYKNKYILC